MLRQVFLDTETTGLDFKHGHRVIEIGCVEMVNRRLTGNKFHYYINPEREVEKDSLKITNITNDFLKDKPLFKEVAIELCDFIKGSELIAHNAQFDVGFLENEFRLSKMKFGKISEHCEVIDTLVLARRLHPGQRNSLDALSKRYNIDCFDREFHGALLDAKILAEVYLAMTSGQMSLVGLDDDLSFIECELSEKVEKNDIPFKVIYANEEELKAHKKFLEFLQSNSE